jgi:alpha-glucosidase
MNAGPAADRLRTANAAAYETKKIGWVLSNHDFTRFATRFGENARAAMLLFLSLPGPVFVFQGDELGTPDGPGVQPPKDRAGRDPFRHPMQWDPSRHGGFTQGEPWLPTVDPKIRNANDQEADPTSTLHLVRRIAELRQTMQPDIELLDSPRDTIVLRRGEHTIAVNLGADAAPVKRPGSHVIGARPGDGEDPTRIPAHGGWIART